VANISNDDDDDDDNLQGQLDCLTLTRNAL
jgi:hypothetical protein